MIESIDGTPLTQGVIEDAFANFKTAADDAEASYSLSDTRSLTTMDAPTYDGIETWAGPVARKATPVDGVFQLSPMHGAFVDRLHQVTDPGDEKRAAHHGSVVHNARVMVDHTVELPNLREGGTERYRALGSGILFLDPEDPKGKVNVFMVTGPEHTQAIPLAGPTEDEMAAFIKMHVDVPLLPTADMLMSTAAWQHPLDRYDDEGNVVDTEHSADGKADVSASRHGIVTLTSASATGLHQASHDLIAGGELAVVTANTGALELPNEAVANETVKTGGVLIPLAGDPEKKITVNALYVARRHQTPILPAETATLAVPIAAQSLRTAEETPIENEPDVRLNMLGMQGEAV